MRPGGQAQLWAPGSAQDAMPTTGCPRCGPFRSLTSAVEATAKEEASDFWSFPHERLVVGCE